MSTSKGNPVATSETPETIIELLTTTGRDTLDLTNLKKLTRLCKKSESVVQTAFHLVSSQLAKQHAEIRLSAFQVADELFQRSHAFRELLLKDFKKFMEQTLGIDYENPLPRPLIAARKLKEQCLQAVHRWNDKFGKDYVLLSLGFNFLKTCKKVDFARMTARTEAEQRRQDALDEHQQMVKNKRLDEAKVKLQDCTREVQECVIQIENCLRLLLPEPEEFAVKGITQRKTSSSDDVTQELISVKGKAPTLTTSNSKIKNVGVAIFKGESSTSISEDDCTMDDDVSNSDVDFDSESDAEVSDETFDDAFRLHGLNRQNYQLEIHLEKDTIEIEETKDNKDVLENLQDLARQLKNKLTSRAKDLLDVFSKECAETEIKLSLDLKDKMEKTQKKLDKLHIIKAVRFCNEDSMVTTVDNDESDDEFEEVEEKEGFEPRLPDHLREEAGLVAKETLPPTELEWKMCEEEQNRKEQDPTEWAASAKRIKENLTEEQKSRYLHNKASSVGETSSLNRTTDDEGRFKRLEQAPVVPFGTDLYHWGQKVEAPIVVRYDSEHRFWTPKDTADVVDQSALDGILRRVIDFTGEWKPVKRSCRAPLPSGKLCPRRDRYKCPFHGRIIARDERGVPEGVNDHGTEVDPQKSKNIENWEDEELMKDIEASTGVDLMQHKKRKSKANKKSALRKKYPGLTDLNAAHRNTARKRLQRKITNKKSLQRVAADLYAVRQKKIQDKFGNQYNYAYAGK